MYEKLMVEGKDYVNDIVHSIEWAQIMLMSRKKNMCAIGTKEGAVLINRLLHFWLQISVTIIHEAVILNLSYSYLILLIILFLL